MALIINAISHCVPYLRCYLPLVYKAGIFTIKYQIRIHFRNCEGPVIIPFVLHPDDTFLYSSGRSCLATEFRPNYQYSSEYI